MVAWSINKSDAARQAVAPNKLGYILVHAFLMWFLLICIRGYLERNNYKIIISYGGEQKWKEKGKKGKGKNEKKSLLSKVIGLESVKEEISYYMDFINNKKKYKKWDVKLPRGVLLAGPPGTGKTLLVKTMAKELDIPVLSAAGSEFVEKYVGVGASRIRDLFKKANRKKKCIIFIDEIDAIGSSRSIVTNSERSSTLNQLLVEMDGFKDSSQIMVFAATNMVKHLDRALVRSGRFDKKIYFDPPNCKEREKLYEMYLSNVDLPKELPFTILAERSAGMTGADIANISNQAKINAIRAADEDEGSGGGGGADCVFVSENNIQEAIDEVMIGREKRERMMSKEERERVAYHEAGHALMGYLLENSEPPIKVSIIPRGEAALGFSQPKPNNKKLHTENAILAMICVLLGGRGGEKLIYNNVSTGAADDIEKISNLIHKYICTWGMHKDVGPINPDAVKSFSECSSQEIFEKSQEIISELERFTFQYLKKYKRYVIKIAKKLLKEETITLVEIKKLVPVKLENSLEVQLGE